MITSNLKSLVRNFTTAGKKRKETATVIDLPEGYVFPNLTPSSKGFPNPQNTQHLIFEYNGKDYTYAEFKKFIEG